MGWTKFARADEFPTSWSVVQELYSNLVGMRADKVPVRGKIVDISPAAINAFYSLPDIAEDAFSAFMRTSPVFQRFPGC